MPSDTVFALDVYARTGTTRISCNDIAPITVFSWQAVHYLRGGATLQQVLLMNLMDCRCRCNLAMEHIMHSWTAAECPKVRPVIAVVQHSHMPRRRLVQSFWNMNMSDTT